MRLRKRLCMFLLCNLQHTKLFLSHPLSIIKTYILLFSCPIYLICRLDNYLFMTRQYPIYPHLKNRTIWTQSLRKILLHYHGVSKMKSTIPWKVSKGLKWKIVSNRISASFQNITFTGTLLEHLRPIPIRQTKNPGSPTPSTAMQPIKVLTLCLLQTRVIQTFASENRLTYRI